MILGKHNNESVILGKHNESMILKKCKQTEIQVMI